MHLHWHRKDLRLSDNRGLVADVDADQTVSLFVFDPTILRNATPPRMAFLLDSLQALQAAYRKRDATLLIAHGNPTDAVPAVANAVDAETVTWCRDYSGLARQRDSAVRRALDDTDIDRHTVDDAVHHAPGEITTNAGDPYKVFTYFSKKWHKRPKTEPVAPPTPDSLATLGHTDVVETIGAAKRGDDEDDVTLYSSIPSLEELGFDTPGPTVPTGGTESAKALLDSFCEGDIYRYAERRDYPADSCTSHLSPHLKYGTIGIRTVYNATEQAKASADTDEERESVYEYQDQLAWREFYTQVLWDRPNVVTANFKEYENPIEWRTDESDLQAWKDGKTGYPIVDAGMRQLRKEGYMHNRVRMIVASFLTKDLLIDWREGYDWFKQKLVDHDTANDNGGWQWAASTGTDSQPYFRIFNPMTQGERYDPDAEYIMEYVDELKGVSADIIHSWHEQDLGTRKRHAADYPSPIVDHSERREQAISMFERARGDE
ncbi:cryptochrome/photolyase family protein [Halovenus rubra]|uniref:Cryptochrome/photolyase family protein n=2 Tax=Halovenus rubra TaxID=869890 RepID=A0ACC7E059_9EURY|nr:deoxyribodipyrimidine photo-lyase [Halovenus rubra]